MKIGSLFSGGKDSTMALEWALNQGYTVDVLISLNPQRSDSYMFHIPNIDKVKFQAEAMGIPLIFEPSSGIKEKELEDLERALVKAKNIYGIEGVTAGALASQYQKERVEKLCEKHNLLAFAPYWHHDELEYVQKIVDSRFETIFTGVAADGMDQSWLGRRLDQRAIEDLKKLKETNRIHICGEGGEYETMVLDAPFFKKKVIINESHINWNENSGHLVIDDLVLEDKK